MPIIIACPTCGGQLRVADDLIGRKVRCPACDATFDSSNERPPPSAAPVGALDVGSGRRDAPSERSAEAPLPPSPPPSPFPTLELGARYREVPLERGAEAPARAPVSAPVPIPAPAPGNTPGLKGAVEIKMPEDGEQAAPPRSVPPRERPDERAPTGPANRPPRLHDENDDLKTCPRCGKHVHRDARSCYNCSERFDEDQNGRGRVDRGPEPMRRDTRPHRGAMILTLGICSILVASIYCISPIALVLGLCAWVMGHNDRRAIKANEMDREGQSSTTAGWVCGMIGAVLGTLEMLSCLVLIGIAVHGNYQQSSNTRPIGAPPPRKARPGQQKWKQPPPAEEVKPPEKAPEGERDPKDK